MMLIAFTTTEVVKTKTTEAATRTTLV